LTDEQQGKLITIEIVDSNLGDQIEVQRKPFAMSSYDPKDDVVIVSVDLSDEIPPGTLQHMISRPTEVDLTVPAPGQTSVRVVADDGSANLLHFVAKPELLEPE
jgi:hypothetical protein